MAAQRSNRPRARRFNDDAWEPDVAIDVPSGDDEAADDEASWSTYRDAVTGPRPVPDWVVTDPRAIDTDLGVVKTGKEAEVSLVRREVPADHDLPDGDARSGLLAAKRYRSAEHRLFHRDAAYLEGRRVRKSREMRAMRTRTDFGKELIAQQWANAEFQMLSQLWSAGAAVPYPVQLIGTELMMEFVGSPDGTAAPRLAQMRRSAAQMDDLYAQLVDALIALADTGYAHGDLSPYNVLVHGDRLVLIDLPQAVDIVGNPQGSAFVRRDCDNICAWFQAHGVPAADPRQLAADLLARAHRGPTGAGGGR